MSIFGELRGLEIEVPQGDFGENLSVRQVLRTKQKRLRSIIRISKTAISEMKDMGRNTLLRVADTISGFSGELNNAENYAKWQISSI